MKFSQIQKESKFLEIKSKCAVKSITILEDIYISSAHKIKCICNICNYAWKSSFNALGAGKGCPKCAGVLKKDINEIKNILLERNIKVLTNKYKNTNCKILCRCLTCNYKWENTTSKLINRKQGCPNCAGKVPKPFIEIKKLALDKNIIILTNEYKNAKAKIDCLCNICNWKWESSADRLNRGRGCPNCAGRINLNFEELNKILLAKNIKCSEYKSITHKSKLQCECLICGFIWKKTYHHLVYRKQGCPKCANRLPMQINDIKHYLYTKNIELISNTCKNSKTKIKCKCLLCNYLWASTRNSLTNLGTGCPNCASGFGEKVCRFVFETIFNKKFIKIRPDWLKHINSLELDGYCAELNIAFEHNGIQHYEFNKKFHKTIDDFKRQQKIDKIKKNSCRNKKIILIEIDNRNKCKFDLLVKNIKNELIKHNILFNDLNIKEESFYKFLNKTNA